jgi:hypothetical protein
MSFTDAPDVRPDVKLSDIGLQDTSIYKTLSVPIARTLQSLFSNSSKSPRVVTMPQFMCSLTKGLDCQFLLSGEPIDPIEVFSPSGALPVLAWIVQDAGKRLLSMDFGCVLKVSSQTTLTGTQCFVPHVTAHMTDITRALFFSHYTTELFGLRAGALIEVSPFFMSVADIFEAQIAEHEAAQQSAQPGAGQSGKSGEGIILWQQVYRNH